MKGYNNLHMVRKPNTLYEYEDWLFHFVLGVAALKDVRVHIPLAAKVMDTVTLQCEYDLEGEPLYTVKWYKGTKEFYRYIPKELPSTLVFPLPGIDVDVSIKDIDSFEYLTKKVF